LYVQMLGCIEMPQARPEAGACLWGRFIVSRGLGVTGHAAGFSRGTDGVLVPHTGRGPAVTANGHLREAADDSGHVVAAMPGQDSGTLDIALLVQRAACGDKRAWERLVDQYARLIWAMTRDFKLAESDAADVFQATWLRLLEHIDRLEHPARVGSWLAATARRECLRSLAARKRVMLVHDDDALKVGAAAHEPEVDERLLAAERDQTVRDALSRLPWRWRRLVELLMADPPASYAEISEQLGLPVGSIGPTRGRCLARLRVLLQAS
jgi:RNA polymerase sigma factor (sigma-70 family)